MKWLQVLGLGGLLLSAGCISCDSTRDVDFTRDLSAGDVAYFKNCIPRDDGGEVLDCSVGIPFLFLPLLASIEEGSADAVAEEEYEFHFEDHYYVGFVITRKAETSKYDDDGRLLSWRSRRSLLAGLLYGVEENKRRTDDGYVTETETGWLFGLLVNHKTRGDESGGTILGLIPYGDDID